jgi:creatinine amidohydrolase
MKSKDLQYLTWEQAKNCLNASSVVVIPLGAQCKEHGLHLPLNTDFVMAEELKKLVASQVEVVFAPTINYAYYPAMIKYPGTVSLSYETTIGMISDICFSFKKFSVRKFYILNTGISTLKPLKSLADQLAHENIILRYTDLNKVLEPVRKIIEQQDGGGHADEIETSIMLALKPEIVQMQKAKKDFTGSGGGPLSPIDDGSGVYSPTGAWGDPTLASVEKGRKLTDALVSGIVSEIHQLSKSS